MRYFQFLIGFQLNFTNPPTFIFQIKLITNPCNTYTFLDNDQNIQHTTNVLKVTKQKSEVEGKLKLVGFESGFHKTIDNKQTQNVRKGTTSPKLNTLIVKARFFEIMLPS